MRAHTLRIIVEGDDPQGIDGMTVGPFLYRTRLSQTQVLNMAWAATHRDANCMAFRDPETNERLTPQELHARPDLLDAYIGHLTYGDFDLTVVSLD